MTVEILGVKRVQYRLRSRIKKYKKIVEPAVRKAAEFLLERTLEITPIDTGRLRNSGKVRTVGSRGDVNAYVEFTAPYAVYVHENLNAYHAPPTTAHFLLISSIMWRASMQRIIRTETEKNL